MSEEQKPQAQVFWYRLITLNGIVIDFHSPNQIEAMWTMFKGDGYCQRYGADGKAAERIPFHAFASLAYHDPSAMALAHAPASSLPKC